MKENHQGDWQIFLFLMRFLVPIWDKVLLVLLLGMIITVVDINTIIIPLATRKFIDQVLAQNDWRMFNILLIVIIIQVVLYFLFNNILELIKYVVSLKLGIRLGMHVFDHVLRLPLRFFQKRPVGEHLYRVGTVFDPGLANLSHLGLLFEVAGSAKGESQPIVGNDLDTVLTMVTQSFDLIFRVVIRMLLILFAISYGVNKSIAIALVVFCIPYIGVIHYLYNIQRRIDFKYRRKSQAFIAGLQEWFGGIKTVKAFGKGRYEVLKNMKRYIGMLRVEWQNYFVKMLTDNFIYLFRYAFIVSVLLYLLIVKSITVGTVVALFLLLEQFFSPINMAVRVIEGIRLQLIPSRRLMETLNEKNTIIEKDDAVSLSPFTAAYDMKHVSFSYTPKQDILTDITFTIEKGRKIGIVGSSGSGKSTLVNLLMRFYDPDRGEILVDSIGLKQLRLQGYYRNIGIVLQDDFLFSGTVKENIRYGKPNATDEEIINAAKMAAVHDDILHFPDGYSTDLAEGTKLSGGQKQRIALARALIRQPSVLILDESTGSLDSKSERTVLETLFRILENKTIIMITHRLNAIKDFDEIFVIDSGLLLEQGNFNALMDKQGIFAAMVKEQTRI